jgi:hypothetical protein
MDDLEELLRVSAPAVDVDGSGPAAARVALEVARRRRYSPRLWQRRTVVGAVAGLVLVPAAVAASVLHFSALTGRFGLSGATENDASQYVNMCASDISRYVATLYPTEAALPPGSSWQRISERYLTSFRSSCPPAGPGTTTQATGIKTSLLGGAQCSWERWTLNRPAADRTADLALADRRLATIEADTATVQRDDGRTGTSATQYQHLEHQYAVASRAFLDYDYQVNCLGRDTGQNPPTVTDPDQ